MRFESSILGVLTFFFSQSNLLYTLLHRFNNPDENLTEWELMLFLVSPNSIVCSDKTELFLAEKKFKGLKIASARVTSIHNKDQSKTQWATFCFKHKTQLARSRQMTQIKKRHPSCGKKDSSVRRFLYRF